MPQTDNIHGTLRVREQIFGQLHEGGGVSDYDELENKPSINGVELAGGDQSGHDLGLANLTDIPAVIDYSTEEQDTGIKWIDGRPIYQKSYTNFANLTGNIRTFDLGLSNIDVIWYVSEGCVCGDLFPFPYVHYDSSNVVGGFWDMNNGSPHFEFRCGNQSGNRSPMNVFTVRYVKGV